MKPGTFTGKSAMPIIMAMFLLILVTITITSAEVTELNVNPQVVDPGDTISISGKASPPNEEVWLKSSFAISLSVSDGKYSREFIGIEFPEGEKEFSVTGENVKNIRVSLSPVFLQTIEYPLEGPLNATDGIAQLSVSFPAEIYGVEMDIHGKKDVKVYGDAADGATSVNLTTGMSIKVTTDSNGDFTLDINTEGVPLGEFLITGGEIKKTIRIGSAESTPTPIPTLPSVITPAPSPTLTPPGFETIFAIAGLLAVAYLILCRRNDD